MLLLSLIAVSPAAADDERRDKPATDDIAQELDWTACYQERTEQTGIPFECADVVVPVDYDDLDFDPDQLTDEELEELVRKAKEAGLAIDIALVRIPASDPGNRQGAILLNPGGPGGSGISFVLGFGPVADIPIRRNNRSMRFLLMSYPLSLCSHLTMRGTPSHGCSRLFSSIRRMSSRFRADSPTGR